MSLPPEVTYVSVPYTTSTEITVTTTIIPTPVGMSYISSSIAPTSILPSSDTTCSTTTSATLSTGFVTSFTTASDPKSTAIMSSSSNSTNAAASTLVFMITSTSSSSPIPSITTASRASIGLPGIIGLSTALGIFFAAIIALFYFYRRKQKFHKEAMLIAPRLSQHKNPRSLETGGGTSTGSNGSIENHVTPQVANPQAPVWHALPRMGSEAEGFAYNTNVPRSLSPASALRRQQGDLSAALTEQRSPGKNIYAIRYNPGGALSVEHEAPEGGHPATNQNPPGWDEALERLRTIHESATLRRELSPPPLEIMKNTTSSPQDQFQPSVRTLLFSAHPDQESMSEMNISESPRGTDVERRRAAALAKLEGRPIRYTAESIYSRRSDGMPFPSPGDGRGRPQWRGLEKYWPD